MIAIDSSKQEAFDADPKAIQQIKLPRDGDPSITVFFIIEEAKKKSHFRFFTRTREIIVILFSSIYQYKMAHCYTFNARLSKSQLKLKSGITSGIKVTLNLSSVIDDFNETNFPINYY